MPGAPDRPEARAFPPLMPAILLAPLLAVFCSVSALGAETIELELREGTNMAVAVSADGRRVVLDTQGTLWLLDADGEGRALTDGLGDDRQPSFSPDGQSVAFQSYRDGLFHIWTLRLDDGDLVRVTNGDFDDREPSWSPDGTRIAFSSDRAGTYDLWILELESGDVRQVTNGEGNDSHPSWSPDGKTMIFVSDRAVEPGIYSVEPDRRGGAPSLVVAAGDRALAAPSWSPGGGRVVFQSLDRPAGRSALERLDPESGETTTLSVEDDDVFPFRAAWLSDDAFLYTANGHLFEGTVDGTRVQRSFRLPIAVDRPVYERRNRLRPADHSGRKVLGVVVPAVSVDGSQVVFTALGDLWLRDADGSLSRLTSGPAVEAHPSFSPDGGTIVFVSDQAGGMDLWTLDLESGRSRRLTGRPGAEAFPAFSPDGRTVAFFAEEIGRFLSARIYSVDLETGEISAPLSSPIPPVQLDWSADGRRLSGLVLDRNSSRFREGSYRVFDLDLSSGTTALWSPLAEGSLAHARLSPDSRRLAWVDGGRLWVTDLESGRPAGEPRPLTDGLADWPAWSGDSEWIVFLAGDRLQRVPAAGGAVEDLDIDLEWTPEDVPGPLVVHAGRLFDGRSSGYRHDVDVRIEGGRIRAIEPHDDAHHQAVHVVDAGERTVLPGLFEMHAHQSISTGEAQGRRWLAFGVTSVREPGTDPYDGAERRESWASGRRVGPRDFFSGRLLDGGRVYYSIAEGTRTADHLDLALERARRMQFDLLKTYVRLSDEAQQRALAAAHGMGIPTSSHEIYPAAAIGMDAVEHASATSRRGYSPKMSLLGRVYDDVVEIVGRTRLNMTPTLVLPCFWPHVAARPELLRDAAVEAFIPEAERRMILARGAAMTSSATAARCAATRSVAEIVKRGGRITAGTDSPIVPYGFSLHVELQLLVEAGLTPFEALRSATLWSAEAVGVADDLGSVEVGKLADLVVVSGDPLVDISDTMRVETTLKGGRVHHRRDLLEPRR